MRVGLRRIMILILALAILLPAIPAIQDRGRRYHHHLLMHTGHDSVLVWTHPTSFLTRYWQEISVGRRERDIACDQVEERKRIHPGYRELDSNHDLAQLIERSYFLRPRRSQQITRVLETQIKVNEIERPGWLSNDYPIGARPDIVDETVRGRE